MSHGFITDRRFTFLLSIFANIVLIFIVFQSNYSERITDNELLIESPAPTNHLNNENVAGASDKDGEVFMVTEVIDGDTIRIENGKAVRYIGIDSPEISQGRECFSQEATDKNKELVLGKKVRLVKDVSETDRYVRLLRYVYVGDTFINEIMISQGYATAASYPPDVRYSELFRRAENFARDNKLGLWGGCGLMNNY